MPAFDSSGLTTYAASWHRSGAAASPSSTTSGNKASSEKVDRKDPFPMPTVTLAQPFTLSPMRFRWSCSGSDAHRRKVATSLAICDMVAGVPGPRTNGENYLWGLVLIQDNALCTVFHRGRDCPLQGFKGIGTLQDYESCSQSLFRYVQSTNIAGKRGADL